MPDDSTPAIDFSRLSYPFLDAAKLLTLYSQTGQLPKNLVAARAGIVAACDRMLADPELPKDWRADVLAIRLEHHDGPPTIKVVRK
jgi:hypothetical protein